MNKNNKLEEISFLQKQQLAFIDFLLMFKDSVMSVQALKLGV